MPTRPFLGLVPLGPVDPEILQHLRTAITKFLSLPVQILPPKPLPLKPTTWSEISIIPPNSWNTCWLAMIIARLFGY